MMQDETNLYEIPADRMVYTHEGLGEGRELGEMEIVSTMWGKARVRPVNKQGKSGWAWALATLAVLAVVAIAWLLLAERDTGSAEPRLLTEPQATNPQQAAPAPSKQDVPAQNAPDTHAAPPPVPAPTAMAAPEPAKQKPLAAAEKQPLADKRNARDVPAQPAGAGKPVKAPATATPPAASTAAPGVPEKQDGQAKPAVQAKQPDTGKAADSLAPASPAKAQPPKADPAGIAQPGEAPVKADPTDSRP